MTHQFDLTVTVVMTKQKAFMKASSTKKKTFKMTKTVTSQPI